MTRKDTMCRLLAATFIPAIALCGCSEDNNPTDSGNDNNGEGKFVFATTITGSNGTAYDLITGESLESGNLTTVNNEMCIRDRT